MSDANNEQITKVPDAKPASKTKDPKKVAAGKKLAEINKKAKDAPAREMKREADPEDKWLPDEMENIILDSINSIASIAIMLGGAVLNFLRKHRSRTCSP